MSTGRVVLYVTPGCHLCHEMTAALEKLGVRFQEIDASVDPARFLRVPIVEVDGEVIGEGPMEVSSLRPTLRRLGLLKRFRWSAPF